MKWFKWGGQDQRPHQTALAMIGAKTGQRILFLGSDDGALAAAVALVVGGMNGRTLVLDPSPDAAAKVERAAAEAGALGTSHHPVIGGEAIRAQLTSAGLRAARVLAEVDGVAYVEGMKGA